MIDAIEFNNIAQFLAFLLLIFTTVFVISAIFFAEGIITRFEGVLMIFLATELLYITILKGKLLEKTNLKTETRKIK